MKKRSAGRQKKNNCTDVGLIRLDERLLHKAVACVNSPIQSRPTSYFTYFACLVPQNVFVF